MEFSITIFLDSSGFLRRECPTCEKEFKCFYGHTESRPDDFLEPENYFCPYCGVPAGKDSWWTPAQLEYAQSSIAGPVMEELTKDLKEEFGRNRRKRGGLSINFEVSKGSVPEPLSPPIDPDDMMIVEPPCHTFEPLKVAEDWLDPIHCLMCGEKFIV
ncbi:hypothetical protein [Streptomyces sp. NPDC014764]|uniref:hypothetical protein n=1 Tax=Streptomyces sp. NPDC014764 TaxID=3364907 RepID=UPI0036F6187B